MQNITFRPVQAHPPGVRRIHHPNEAVTGTDFSQHLKQALRAENKLNISKHAKERLAQREISINEKRWSQIEDKINEARKMGVKESLVLLSDAALIVSAKNNTVITAMNREEAVSQIFTNINGTIVLE